MRDILKYGLWGLVAVAAILGLEFVSLTSSEISAGRLAAIDSEHMAGCRVCRLPLYGTGSQSSHFGPLHAR